MKIPSNMRYILVLSLCILSFAAHTQGVYPSPVFIKANPGAYGARNARGEFDSAFYFVAGCGAPTDTTFLFSQQNGGRGEKPKLWALYGDSCGHKVYAMDPSTRTWQQLGSGGSGFDTTTIYANLAKKVTNQGGILYWGASVFAARPVASIGTGLWYETDSNRFSYSNGTTWTEVLGGSGTGGGGGPGSFSIRMLNSGNFAGSATNCAVPELNNDSLQLFWNDLGRFLVEGTEWRNLSGGGFTILIPAFDATANSYTLTLYANSTASPPGPVSFTSSAFSTSTQCPITAYNGMNLQIFWNDADRYLVQGTEWTPLAGGGFTVTVPGFNATTTNYSFYVFAQ